MPAVATSRETERLSIDEAAFGVIYGAITVMGVLVATGADGLNPLVTAGVLFTTVLAVALAKAYADVASSALRSGRNADRGLIAKSWAHSRTTLIAANGPTLAMLLGAAGFYSTHVALILAQLCAIGLLFFYGARIGLRLTGRIVPAMLGAAFTGGIGLALGLLKNVLH
ncbi:MAG: hypothetical protein NXH88_01195 [Hyphomonas sp.]|nr:hypothetical protein [Hyphomonas sp.]